MTESWSQTAAEWRSNLPASLTTGFSELSGKLPVSLTKVFSSAPLNDAETGGAASGDQSDEASLFARLGEHTRLTHKQRAVGFVGFLIGSAISFTLASLFLPFVSIFPRKFFLLFTLGSLFSMCAFSMLHGPWEHLKHMMSAERRVFSLSYIGSLFATLYAAMALHSAILTLICGSLQIYALLWLLFAYIPGGTYGLQILFKIAWVALRSLFNQFLATQ